MVWSVYNEMGDATIARMMIARGVDVNVSNDAGETALLADGGWAQLPGLEPDAWAAGQTLVALHQAGGLKITHPSYQRGIEFLLRTQFEDGSWWVRSRTCLSSLISTASFLMARTSGFRPRERLGPLWP